MKQRTYRYKKRNGDRRFLDAHLCNGNLISLEQIVHLEVCFFVILKEYKNQGLRQSWVDGTHHRATKTPTVIWFENRTLGERKGTIMERFQKWMRIEHRVRKRPLHLPSSPKHLLHNVISGIVSSSTHRVYRLEIDNFWRTFSHVRIFDSVLWSVFSSVAPLPFSLVHHYPSPLPYVWISTVYVFWKMGVG